MPLFYKKADESVLNFEESTTKPLLYGGYGFVENFKAAKKNFESLGLSSSKANLLVEQWKPLIDEIQSKQNVTFTNPANHLITNLSPFLGMGKSYSEAPSHLGGLANALSFSYEYITTDYQQQYKNDAQKIIDHIRNNKTLYPDYQDFTLDSIEELAKEQARLNHEQFQDAQERSSGALSITGSFLGDVTATFKDPIILQSMALPVGVYAKTLKSIMLAESMVAMGAEAILQPSVKKWYKETGLEDSYPGFLQSIATAGVGGALFPAGLKGVEVFANLTTAQIQKGLDLFYNKKITKKIKNKNRELKNDDYTLKESFDNSDEILKDNPIEDVVEHETRLNKAHTTISNGDIPNISTKAASKKKSTDIYQNENLGTSVFKFNPNELEVEPKTFQYKIEDDVDEFGVSADLRNVDKWQPELSNQIMVYEYANGKKVIADGHQRFALAKRIQAKDPSQKVELIGSVFREKDGYTPSEIRVKAALKNITEQSSADRKLSAARILKEDPEAIKGLNLRSELVRQANGLSKLTDANFQAVMNGVIPANYGSIIGRLTDDDLKQQAIIKTIKEAAPDNATQAEAIVRQILAQGKSGVELRQQVDLFGEQTFAETLYKERAKIIDLAVKTLQRDKTVFKSLVDNVSKIESEGNQVAKAANQRRALEDEKAIELIQKLANYGGEISEALSKAAQTAKDTNNFTEATKGFVNAIRTRASKGDIYGDLPSESGRTISSAEEVSEVRDAAEGLDDFDNPTSAAYARQSDQLYEDLFGDDAPDIANKPIPDFNDESAETLTTIGEVKKELDQEQEMLDRLRPCAYPKGK